MAYKIVRNYFRCKPSRTVKRGLTLQQAQEHCRDPETSSSTAVGYVARQRTKKHGQWFDSYTECTK